MPNTPVTKGLIEALAEEVRGLRSAYENYRKLFAAIGVMFAALIVVIVWLFQVAQDAKKAADDVETAQLTNCQNANNTRANQTQVWDFVLNLSGADAGPQETAALESIKAWIHDVFAERDCSDQTKKYDVPVPPDIKQLLEQFEQEQED